MGLGSIALFYVQTGIGMGKHSMIRGARTREHESRFIWWVTRKLLLILEGVGLALLHNGMMLIYQAQKSRIISGFLV